MPVITTIKLRRGTAAAWTAANPTLADGEEGHETDTGLRKIGPGAWNSLAYFNPVPSGTYAGTTTPGVAMTAADALLAAFAPVAADRVIYVSKGPQANDANNGLSGGKAKATIAGAIAALAGGTGKIKLLHGTFSSSAQLAVSSGSITIEGLGPGLSVINYTAAGGQAIDWSTSGPHFLRDLSVDGTDSSGSAGALRIASGLSRNICERVHFSNFGGGAAIAVVLEGALDNTFTDCVFTQNARHLELKDSASYPSNQNIFRGCHFVAAALAAGIAISVINGEGNVFDTCLAQGNLSITTLSITRTVGGLGDARGNLITGRTWFESNGATQAGSRHIRIAGADASTKVAGTVIDGALLFASVQDDPSSDIELEYADATGIDRAHSNLGSPHYFIKHGAGVTNTRNSASNIYTGQCDAPRFGPAFALRKSGGGQTVFTGGAFTKITFNNTDVDTHTDVASSTFTPSVPGVYTLNTQLSLENATDAEPWTVAIYKNGVAVVSIPRPASGTGWQTYDATAVVEANGTTDYFEVFLANNGVTARNVGAGSTFAGAKTA